MNYNFGSEWQKWDLHIHTPFTKLSDNFSHVDGEDIWKTFCDKLENSDVEVFGITDYFCVENYFTFRDKHKSYYPDSKKIFFPNIEFRLEVSVNKKGEEVNIHVIFSDQISKSKLDSFLSKLDTNITVNDAKVTCKELCDEQFVSAGIQYSRLHEILKEVFGAEVCYLIIAASNNAGLRADSSSPRKLAITDEIDKKCDGFFGGIQNVDHYLKTDRYETNEISIPKPVVTGSDCHSFDDIDNFLGKRFQRLDIQTGKEIIEKDITWIKSEKSFEGLRQILHEPQYRKSITNIVPRQPIRKIEKIKFNFPENIRIKNKNSNEYQNLCIKNLKKEIFLSPYFTCFIGGRGTGKSTIINTIAERLGTQTDFFHPSHNTLYLDDNVKCDLGNTHKNFVEIEGTNDVEFVSQGKVEKLTEGKELTKLIFEERILQPNSAIQELKVSVDKHIELIDDQNYLIADLKQTQEEIEERKKEKLTHESIVNSIADPLYSEITKKIKELSKRLAELDNSEIKYSVLVEKLRSLIEEIQIDENRENEYENRLKEIRLYILAMEEYDQIDNKVIAKKQMFDQTTTLREETTKALVEEQVKLKKFFEQKGTSEENIKDSQNANASLASVISNIKASSEKVSLIKSKLKTNFLVVKGILELKLQSEAIIRSAVEELSAKLDRKNENVSSISYQYKFNKAAYENALFEDFKQTFNKYHIANTSWDDVRSLLFKIEPDDSILNKPYLNYYKELNQIIDDDYDRSRNYVNVVSNIFCDILNFRIYQYLIYKHFFNVFKYVEIEGFYGSRELKSCSFGQKCTAVIVTLLMTGVKPLIIDEPEAHLDNKLIADYLVNLIKEKKADRQIIFATHNANFVINGDAELIYILEVPDDDDCTVITATTIENKRYRDKLLKLEGGREAFEKREKRLLKTSF